MCLGAIVANRVLPEELAGSEAADSAAELFEQASGPLADAVADQLDAPVAQVRSVLAQVAMRFDDVALVAARESDRRAELAAMAPTMIVGSVARRRHPRPRRARTSGRSPPRRVNFGQNQR